MSEKLRFPPSPTFSQSAHISSETTAERFSETARAQPDAFWAELAKVITFDQPYTQVLEWKRPKASWFVNGKLNVSRQCLDRHLTTHPNKTALIWEGEPTSAEGIPSEERRLSYKELHALTCQIAWALKNMGIEKGDRIAIYMPMLPETVAAMLACARIGAIHTVIFGGFSAQSIADRIQDSGARLIITADGTYRKGKFLALKPIIDEALEKIPSQQLHHVLVYRRDPQQECPMTEGRDREWEKAVLHEETSFDPVSLDSEDPLFILYTSGTTGKPKGLFHTQAGYILWAHWSTRWLFDIKNDDIFWCTADCGWITGHTYVTYGPLSNGATVFLYEGAPLTPKPDRFWSMIERHKINILYTAPTAIRTFMRLGHEYPQKRNLNSLRLLGTVGEPINPEAWLWYHQWIGAGKCPVVDTWWQTETGGAMIAPMPGAHTLKPGSAMKPLPGIEADVVNPETGVSCQTGEKGVLVIKQPWPSMARGIWGDPLRYEKTYWNTKNELEGVYVTADFAMKDKDGDFWIEGRMDDVLNVSGHRLGSAEIESALVSHHDVAEAAVVGVADNIKGQSIAAFVTLKDRVQTQIKDQHLRVATIKSTLRDHVGNEIGAFAKPDQIRLASALPKTRSGKIMRRLLRELATTGEMRGDTSTLEDFSPQSAIDEE